MKKYFKVSIGILLVLFVMQAATATPTVQELDMNDAVTASDAGAGDLEGRDILLIIAIVFAIIGLIVVLALI
jgi:hypothetical protein